MRPKLLLNVKGFLRSTKKWYVTQTCYRTGRIHSEAHVPKWVFIATTVLPVDRCWNTAMVRILIHAASQPLDGRSLNEIRCQYSFFKDDPRLKTCLTRRRCPVPAVKYIDNGYKQSEKTTYGVSLSHFVSCDFSSYQIPKSVFFPQTTGNWMVQS